MKRGTPDHPKMMNLAEAIFSHFAGTQLSAFTFELCHSLAVGMMERLWHYTARYAPAGDIGKHSDARISAAVGWPGEPRELIAILVATEWLDAHDSAEVRFFVHDWDIHSDELADRYLASHGLMYSNGSRPRTKSYAKHRKSRPHRDKVATPSRQSEPEPEPEPEPPPPPAAAAPVGGNGGGNWRSTEEALALAGVADASGAVKQAKSRGIKPAEIVAILNHYRSRDGDWGPGALHARIAGAIPGEPPSARWPPPDTSSRDRKAKADRLSQRDREIAANRIIKEMRREGKADPEIKAALASKGLVWP